MINFTYRFIVNINYYCKGFAFDSSSSVSHWRARNVNLILFSLFVVKHSIDTLNDDDDAFLVCAQIEPCGIWRK